LNQPLAALTASFAQATNPVVKGFMVGRSLWAEPSMRWFGNQIDDDTLVREVADNFALLVDAWRTRHSALNHATQD
jgi:5-dehydro-2-deoxygluconokinase